jgi:hypothetical protein
MLLSTTQELKLFMSEIFHLIFSDSGWPWVIATMESETVDQGGGKASVIYQC